MFFKKASLIAALAVASVFATVPAANAAVVVRGGHFAARRGWYPYGGWHGGWGWGWGGWYDPWWYGPGYYYAPNTGNVKIDTHAKDDAVYVDGGFVGTVADARKLPLRPGNHDIQVRSPNGDTVFQETVRVIRGKTVHIRPQG